MTRGGAPVPDGSMLEALVDGVLTIDRDGRIVGLDPRAALLFGLRPHETALGRPVADLIPSLRLPEALSTWGGRRRGAGPRVIARRVESLALRADGAGLPIELTLTDTGEEPPRITAWIRALSRVEGDHAALAQRTALLEAAERLAQSGSWDWNLLTNELVWSDNMYRLFGLEPGAIPPSPDYVSEQTHPDDRPRVREAIRRARGTGSLAPLPFRIVRGDGEVRHLHATTTIVAAGGSGGRRLVGVLQDVTDRRRAEREIAAHFAVSEALLEWETLERGGPRLLGNLAEAMDFEVGFLWVPLDDVLVARCTWRAPSVRASRFEAATGRARLRPGCDLPGRVWRAREPINLAFLPPAADLPRRDAALRAGLRGAMAFPAGTDAEVLAILELYSREEAQATARLMRSLTAIGYELGQFLARRRGQLQPQPLTPRELEVLRMAAQGLSRRRIAEQLVVSETTIKTHFENVYAKFGVTDRASAVAKVLRLGLIE